MFRNEDLNGPDEDTEDSEDEFEEVKTKKKKNNDREMFAAAMDEDYASMPYPIIIDSGAAESVLPTNWCPQSKLQAGASKGKTYSAANGSKIKNQGEKTVSMIT